MVPPALAVVSSCDAVVVPPVVAATLLGDVSEPLSLPQAASATATAAADARAAKALGNVGNEVNLLQGV